MHKASVFSLDEKPDRGCTDTPNPDIHNLAYLSNLNLNLRQRPAFNGTPKQSRKNVLRQFNINDTGSLGVDKGSQRAVKLHGLQIARIPSWADCEIWLFPFPAHQGFQNMKKCRIRSPT